MKRISYFASQNNFISDFFFFFDAKAYVPKNKDKFQIKKKNEYKIKRKTKDLKSGKSVGFLKKKFFSYTNTHFQKNKTKKNFFVNVRRWRRFVGWTVPCNEHWSHDHRKLVVDFVAVVVEELAVDYQSYCCSSSWVVVVAVEVGIACSSLVVVVVVDFGIGFVVDFVGELGVVAFVERERLLVVVSRSKFSFPCKRLVVRRWST